MTMSATARVPTAQASKYLQQLCKHWQHNLAVEFPPDHGTVTFPTAARGADWPGEARVAFDPPPNALAARLPATAAGHIDALQGAVAAHLAGVPFPAAPPPSVYPRP